jgi:hypothetical protein
MCLTIVNQNSKNIDNYDTNNDDDDDIIKIIIITMVI